MSNVLMILGSRNPDGQTATAAEALADGCRSAGATVDAVYLPQKQLERCRQCDDDGWGLCRRGDSCVIDDDLAPLMEAMSDADLVVVATPVYFGDLSESMKALLDRVRRVAVNRADSNPLVDKPCVGIAVAGGGGGGSFSCLYSLERILQTCGFRIVDQVSVRRQNMELKRQVLRQTGVWLVENLNSSPTQRGR